MTGPSLQILAPKSLALVLHYLAIIHELHFSSSAAPYAVMIGYLNLGE